MKIDVLKAAERRIKIATETLRHVGDATDLRGAVGFASHITAKHRDTPLLDDANTRDQPQQSGLADTVRTDHADHAVGRDINRNIVERDRFPVPMGNMVDLGYDAIRHQGRHQGSFTARLSGQATAVSVRTKPMPRTPVFTCLWYLPSTFGSTWSLMRKISF